MGTAQGDRSWHEPALLAWLVNGEVEPAGFTATLADLARRGLLRFRRTEDGILAERLASARSDWEARVLELLFRAAADPDAEVAGAGEWQRYYAARPGALERWWSEWQEALAQAAVSQSWGEANRKGILRRRADARALQARAWSEWRDEQHSGVGALRVDPDSLEEYARLLSAAIALGVEEPWCAALDRRLSISERAEVGRGWCPLDREGTLAGSLTALRQFLPLT